jgi:hypothetical protein
MTIEIKFLNRCILSRSRAAWIFNLFQLETCLKIYLHLAFAMRIVFDCLGLWFITVFIRSMQLIVEKEVSFLWKLFNFPFAKRQCSRQDGRHVTYRITNETLHFFILYTDFVVFMLTVFKFIYWLSKYFCI